MQTAIIEYYPPAVARIREIKQIARAEDIEFAKLRGRMTSAVNNLFIFTANEEGISRLEKVLNITANKKQKLEDRKLYILSVLNRKKMSLFEIEKLLKNYADVGLHIDNDAEKLNVNITNNTSNVKLIYRILDDFMPLNLCMEFGTETSFFIQLVETPKILEMETTAYVRGGVENAWFLDGSVPLDGSRLLDAEIYVQTVVLDPEMVTKIKGLLSTDTELTAIKDLWFLDGSVPLDGSRLLDAEIREEAI